MVSVFNPQIHEKLDVLVERRSRHMIRLGFALVMLVIAFVVVFGLIRLNEVHKSLAEVVDTEQAAIEMLFHMQQTSRERSVVLYRIASSADPFERDELSIYYSELGVTFGEYRRRLNELRLDEHEKEMLRMQREYIQTTLPYQQQVIDAAISGNPIKAQEILSKRAIPMQEKILETINQMLAHEIDDSHAHMNQLQDQQSQTRILIVSAGLLGIIFAGLIAGFVNRRMSNLISGLSDSHKSLQEAYQRLESLNLAMDQHNIVSIADINGDITFVNEKFCTISEYTPAELLGQNHRILNSGIQSTLFFAGMWHTISSGKVWQGEVCNRNKTGKLYWEYTTIVPFLGDDGKPYQYISARTDITSIKQAQIVLMRSQEELQRLVESRTEELAERERLLESITSAAQDAVVLVDHNGHVNFWNQSAASMFGYTSQEMMGQDPGSRLVPARYLAKLIPAFREFVQTGSGALIGTTTETEALRKDGKEFPIEISLSGVQLKGYWYAVAIVRDITVRKQAEEQLRQLATTDTLTGAFNRRRFNEVLDVEIARARRYGTPFGLIILDIDHFKQINDKLGHPCGDAVLVGLSSLIAGNIRNTDIFARWGGEEFVLLTANASDCCPRQLAEKLRFLIEHHEFPSVKKVSCSFGVTLFEEGDSPESILKRADTNLYRAKESGRNCVISDF